MGEYEFRDAACGELRFMKGDKPFHLANSSQFYIAVRSCSVCGNLHYHLPLDQFPRLYQLYGHRDRLGWITLTYECPDRQQAATIMLSPADAERAVRAVKRG